MKTSAEIRLENMRQLAAEAGSVADLGRVLGMSSSQANQIAGPNPSRNIGSRLARRAEKLFGKPDGWLDVEHPKAIIETLRDMQIAEINRLLQDLSDFELTQCLAWLQELPTKRP